MATNFAFHGFEVRNLLYNQIKIIKHYPALLLYHPPPQAHNALIIYKLHVMDFDDKAIISQLKPRVLLFSPLAFLTKTCFQMNTTPS
jgi:hypothetical protein